MNDDIYKDLFKSFNCTQYTYDHANELYHCDNIRIVSTNYEKIFKNNNICVDFGDVGTLSLNNVPLIKDSSRFPRNIKCLFLVDVDDFEVYDGQNIKIHETDKMPKKDSYLSNRLCFNACSSLTHIINVDAYDANVDIKYCRSLTQFSSNTHLRILDITYGTNIKSFKNVKVSSVDDCSLISTGIEDFSFCEDTLFGKLEIDCFLIKDYTKIENLCVINKLVLLSVDLTSELNGFLHLLNVKTRDIKFSNVELNEIFSKYFENIKISDRIEHIMDVVLDCHAAGFENVSY